ncbi:MAG TPA: hypothetical protein DCE41_26190 [Cytophagales bacterium]|nr:hypothetical protein [Cytophagales bacterium]HAP62304.1 hypothetical protein [Cytophagales bacterium]
MKAVLIALLLCWIPVAPVWCQGTTQDPYITVDRDSEISGGMEYVITHSFDIVGVNWEKGLVATKQVYEIEEQYGEEGEVSVTPYNCGYAGMEKQPLAGVILGVYDLNAGAFLETFTVYASVGEASACLSHTESVASLEAAKAYWTSQGVGNAAKPTVLAVKEFAAQHPQLQLELKNYDVPVDENDFYRWGISEVWMGGEVVYGLREQHTPSALTGVEYTYYGVVSQGDGFFLLGKSRYFNLWEPGYSHEYPFVTPVFKH